MRWIWIETMFADAQKLFLRSLANIGFHTDRPAPPSAWQAFKVFATAPLPRGLKSVTIGYQCLHVDDRDDVLWFGFTRQVEDDSGAGGNIGCLFARPVPAEFAGINESVWWWPEHGTLKEWFTQVEGRRAFSACMSYTDWRWGGLGM